MSNALDSGRILAIGRLQEGRPVLGRLQAARYKQRGHIPRQGICAYFGPLRNLPKDFINSNFASSRTPGHPMRYARILMRERAADLVALLKDTDTHFHVCGLKSVEEGVVLELYDAAQDVGLTWESIGAALKREGRRHPETY